MIGGPSSGPACGPVCSGAARCDWVPAAYACLRRLFSGLPPSSQPYSLGARRAPGKRKSEAHFVTLHHVLMRGSAWGELLGKLKTVPLWVEYVQKAHLAVQLEDDAHFYTLVP